MWNECAKVDIKSLALVKEDTRNRHKWRSLKSGNCSTLPQCGKEGVVLYELRSRHV